MGPRSTELTNGGGVVYARALKGFMDLAAALGASPERIARSADFDLSLLAIPDALLPVASYYRLHEQFLAHTGNPDFGLLSGRVSYMESAQLFLYLASASKTLRDWLNMLPSVSSLLGDVGAIRIARHRDYFRPGVAPGKSARPGSLYCDGRYTVHYGAGNGWLQLVARATPAGGFHLREAR